MTTPGELVTGRQCTSGCIAATTEVSRCRCPCAGRFHGLVTLADVSTLVESRRAGRDKLSDAQVINNAAA